MNDPTATYVAIIRARDRLYRRATSTISGIGLSEPQFNVLRILRGATSPLPTSELGRRMITRVPDITRLVDRLESGGLVCRHRAPQGDRRKVLVEITPAGLKKISPLDEELAAQVAEMFDGLKSSELDTLVDLLDRVSPGS
ncbi:MarR family transcriptional regulator [bacterium]|nr:MAG: MarR family transcriptional regulator [bacterium]RKZ14896.1 MAG: MarR family transcriptional regulator [bacterium]